MASSEEGSYGDGMNIDHYFSRACPVCNAERGRCCRTATGYMMTAGPHEERLELVTEKYYEIEFVPTPPLHDSLEKLPDPESLSVGTIIKILEGPHAGTRVEVKSDQRDGNYYYHLSGPRASGQAYGLR